MKKVVVAVVLLLAAGIGAGAYYRYFNTPDPPEVLTAVVSRGDVAEVVGATGTLEAVTTVQVGTQVSGTIQALAADFNSVVRKGQVIARLDPSLFGTQIEQARANLSRSEADMERLRVAVDDARSKLRRAEELAARELIARQDLEASQLALRSAEAQLRSSQAAVTQARATLNQSQVNLQHTVIEAPIDGIVISRNVDVGQTVAASMQAPTLFVIAADLTKMRVNANIDEADVGRIRPGQRVRFRVDAFPSEEFIGTVAQIRLQPQTVQNVVTYATLIEVPNPTFKLKPGMTANVSIEIARRTDVLRIPNAALRFRPTAETFAALGQPVPPELERGPGRGRPGATTATVGSAAPGGAANEGTGSPEAAARPDVPPAGPAGVNDAARPSSRGGSAQGRQRSRDASGANSAVPSADSRIGSQGGAERGGSAARRAGGGPGGADLDPAERRKRMLDRLDSLSSEQREEALRRMRARGLDPTTGEGFGTSPDARAGASWQRADTIDALFGPLPTSETAGRAWIYVNQQLKPVRLRLGISDGAHTEVLSDELMPGQDVVTTVAVPVQATRASGGQSPLMGPQRPGGPPGVRNATPSRTR